MTGLHLEEFVDARTLAPYMAERRADYEDKAIDFLRQTFPRRVPSRDDAPLRRIVRLAYPRARLRGIRTERDHLKYLIAVMHWGSHFEDDPTHASRLFRAGWRTAQGAPCLNPYLVPVLDQIDLWHRDTRQAGLNPHLLAEWSQDGAHLADDDPDSRLSRLAALWPRVAAATPMPDRRAGLAQAGEFAARFELCGRGTLVYAAIAQLLGSGFGTDPLYPWAARALTMRGTQDDPAQALAAGFIGWWNAVYKAGHEHG